MTKSDSNPYSAGGQGLGYIYQPRFGLLRLLQLTGLVSVGIVLALLLVGLGVG